MWNVFVPDLTRTLSNYSKGEVELNKYLFTFPYDKIRSVELILKNTEKPRLISADKKIYAKSSKNGNRILLYHGIRYRNSFMPIFELILTEKYDNCTTALGFWRWHLFTIAFTCIFMFLVLSNLVGGIIEKNHIQIITMILFALFYSLLCIFGTWLERKNMKRIIEHLRILENR